MSITIPRWRAIHNNKRNASQNKVDIVKYLLNKTLINYKPVAPGNWAVMEAKLTVPEIDKILQYQSIQRGSKICPYAYMFHRLPVFFSAFILPKWNSTNNFSYKNKVKKFTIFFCGNFNRLLRLISRNGNPVTHGWFSGKYFQLKVQLS